MRVRDMEGNGLIVSNTDDSESERWQSVTVRPWWWPRVWTNKLEQTNNVNQKLNLNATSIVVLFFRPSVSKLFFIISYIYHVVLTATRPFFRPFWSPTDITTTTTATVACIWYSNNLRNHLYLIQRASILLVFDTVNLIPSHRCLYLIQ